MNRPKYETEKDLDHERVVAATTAARLMRIARKTPDYYPCDYCFAPTENSEGHWVLAEVKTRKAKYPSYMISLHKVAELILYCEVGGFVPMIAVLWLPNMELGLCDLKRSMLQPGWGGRQDRGDPQDMEPVCFIDLQHFRVSPF